jgi:hypothetical protein
MVMSRVLWIVHGVLALVFLFADGMKLVTWIAVVAAQSPFPGDMLPVHRRL